MVEWGKIARLVTRTKELNAYASILVSETTDCELKGKVNNWVDCVAKEVLQYMPSLSNEGSDLIDFI